MKYPIGGAFSVIPGTPIEDVREMLSELEGNRIKIVFNEVHPGNYSFCWGYPHKEDGHFSLIEDCGSSRRKIDYEIASLRYCDPQGNPFGEHGYHHVEISRTSPEENMTAFLGNVIVSNYKRALELQVRERKEQIEAIMKSFDRELDKVLKNDELFTIKN